MAEVSLSTGSPNVESTAFRTFEDSLVREMENRVARYINNYFGDVEELLPGPQGFLVNMPAEYQGHAHFHGADQFQIFFGTPGARYQRHAMAPVMVHYADAYATYGPFSTASNPIQFFTLRAKADLLTGLMPEDRDLLRHKGRRNVHVSLADDQLGPVSSGNATIETLFGPDPDKMAAFWVRAGNGDRITGPSPEGSSGQYYCIVDGTAKFEDRLISRLTLGWVAPDDEAPTLAGADSGFHAIVLQFPSPPTSQ